MREGTPGKALDVGRRRAGSHERTLKGRRSAGEDEAVAKVTVDGSESKTVQAAAR
jgi:hypothetical protein